MNEIATRSLNTRPPAVATPTTQSPQLRMVVEESPEDSGGAATSLGIFMPLPVVQAPIDRQLRSPGQSGLDRHIAERTPARNRAPGSSRPARGVVTGPKSARSRWWCRDLVGASLVRTTHRIDRRAPRGSRHGSLSTSAPYLPYQYCRTNGACAGQTEWLHLGEISRIPRPSPPRFPRGSASQNFT